ncbi:serine hydrolase domain-containing protein [Actinomadura harenae]|uniref:Class A beta-lactamase-related serine hydrolase n=1 Tax=Actinomadura harenae TaxID=2483351 RepID=A0A3M2M336_9ACTN|nr:serine hydrolase domain-containing protein [Actinomadura harenae]RMI44051.1 class A beta-lactamase-related serine hydrolase [Actinomadura harenae]
MRRSVAALATGVVAIGTASTPDLAGAAAAGTARPSTALEPTELQSALDAVHHAGMPGVYADVRDGDRAWRGASGVADVRMGRPVTPDMRQRVGSITKTFTAAAVMQQVENARIRLDAPIGDYLPTLVPGERGKQITVRMLLNHTSGIPEYLPYAFPSLRTFPSPDASTKSLDDNRYRRFSPAELIKMGLDAPPTGRPGGPTGVYSNANYLLLGQLLEKVTGIPAEKYITREVIGRAGLKHTWFPDGPHLRGPHSRMYEAFYGKIDPPRDYSEYDMSWVGTGAALVSTTADLDRFYGLLFSGRIVAPSSLAEMQRTVPVLTQDGQSVIDYGLGLRRIEIPGCGTFWGHDGTVWGAQTISVTSADGRRRMSVAMNLVRWNKPDASGKPQRHPIDDALLAFYRTAMCGTQPTDSEHGLKRQPKQTN